MSLRLGKSTSERICKENEKNIVDIINIVNFLTFIFLLLLINICKKKKKFLKKIKYTNNISTHNYHKIYNKEDENFKKKLPKPLCKDSVEEKDELDKNNINNDLESNIKFSSSKEENTEKENENSIKEINIAEEIKEIKESEIKNENSNSTIEELKNEESINYDLIYNKFQNIQKKVQMAEINMHNMGEIKFNSNDNNISIHKLDKEEDIKSENLQNNYKNGNNAIRQVIFNDLIGKYYEKSLDEYYNYLIGTIIEIEGNQCYYKIKIIADELKGNYFKLSEDHYGTYVVQKLIQFLDNDELKIIVDELISNPRFEYLMYDSNGNHVIQKLIKNLNKEGEDFRNLFSKIYEKIVPYCKNKYSCYIIQELIEKCDIIFINEIIDKIKIENLLNDSFGLHVVQKLLEIYNKKNSWFDIDFIYKYFDHINIYEKILQNNGSISSSFSKIIQLIIQKGNKDKNANIINKLLEDKKQFLLICSNSFGNYVIQKVYDNSSEDMRNKIFKIIEENKNINNNKFFNYVKRHILK